LRGGEEKKSGVRARGPERRRTEITRLRSEPDCLILSNLNLTRKIGAPPDEKSLSDGIIQKKEKSFSRGKTNLSTFGIV